VKQLSEDKIVKINGKYPEQKKGIAYTCEGGSKIGMYVGLF